MQAVDEAMQRDGRLFAVLLRPEEVQQRVSRYSGLQMKCQTGEEGQCLAGNQDFKLLTEPKKSKTPEQADKHLVILRQRPGSWHWKFRQLGEHQVLLLEYRQIRRQFN